MGELQTRRTNTEKRLARIRQKLDGAEKIAAGKACVYATGSFGRCEASSHSDLDLFILSMTTEESSGKHRNVLRRLDEILIKAELIEVTQQLGIPEFSGDGRFLDVHSVHELTKTLGRPEDDVTNTFTARLLLLLESRCLVEEKVYREVIQEVIAAYWRDYGDHKANFMPAFLANDILRLWRTFCVNYEAGTERVPVEKTERVPVEKKAKGKLKNYKLKHSRLLTCYSAILYLLAVYRQHGTVSPDDVLKMIKMSPTERLEWMKIQEFLKSAHGTITSLLAKYEEFLEATNADETELITRFMDREASQKSIDSANEFGDLMFKALNLIGANDRFHRLLVV
jgi:predicted nucleotidyltransferase